ncbi:hypothetical protein L1987_26051 [Smallanthus sonchifolius]|uniref:Uncharacterized protein n=1 Tax=Smallanthus sonchifolius TaxID=185202 RepID=A0ACB9I9X2_9ASTR|nr:hypothetical protein L1987_26051 [Smallanthus sonchifolius]
MVILHFNLATDNYLILKCKATDEICVAWISDFRGLITCTANNGSFDQVSNHYPHRRLLLLSLSLSLQTLHYNDLGLLLTESGFRSSQLSNKSFPKSFLGFNFWCRDRSNNLIDFEH